MPPGSSRLPVMAREERPSGDAAAGALASGGVHSAPWGAPSSFPGSRGGVRSPRSSLAG